MKTKVYAYLHTHWDREWYRDKEDFNIRLLEVFDIVLDELVNNRAPFFYFDGQVVALLDYLKYREEKKDLIKKLIQEKKLAIGPYYASIDSFLASFPVMAKNLELGLKISKEFNQQDFIGYMADIFGISKSAFLVLEMNNINNAIIWRGVNPKLINNNCNFKYNSINTVWLVQGYFNDFCHNKNIEGLKKYLDKISKFSPSNCLLPIGADHLGMLKNANEIIFEINSKIKDYEIILCNPFEYFKNNKFEKPAKCLEFLDNSDTYILQGVYSSRIYQKVKNIEIENKLSRIVEVLNYSLKENFSKNIDYIYETLIKNHAHDGIYGCSIDSVHRAINARQEKCENILNSILKTIIFNFKKKYNLSNQSTNKLGLFNLSNFNNIKTIKIKLPYILKNSQIISKEKGFSDNLLYDCYKIPVTEDITDIYTQLVEISENKSFEFNTVAIKKPKKLHKITKNSIENDFIKLILKNNKITIKDKKTDNSFNLKITDIKDEGDSYNFSLSGEYKILNPINSEILYDGEIESVLRINFKNINLDIKLNNYSKFLKFSCLIKNKTKNHKLQLSLELQNKITKTVSSDAIGVMERKINPDYNIQDYMPAKRPIELKTNTYPMQNFVITNNVIVLTKGLHEYEIFKNELKICLLRCFSTISNPKNKVRSIPAGPDLKTPEAQCLGENEVEFALLFGNEKIAFLSLDEFYENYVTIDGITKDFNLNLTKHVRDSFIYGINDNRILSYNFKNKTCNL